MEYHGQMALQIGVLVAFTQLIPEHQVQLLGIFTARVKVWLAAFGQRRSPANLPLDTSNGLCHVFYSDVHRWVSMSIYSHSVWMACLVDLAPIL